VLVNEENIVLETCVKVSLEAQFADDRVVMAVDVGINAVHALEDLSDHAWE